MLDLLGSKEDGTAVDGDKILFVDATDNVIRQATIDAMLDLLGSKADGTAVDGDKIVFVDATDNVVKQVTISTMFVLLVSKADDTPALTNKMFFVDSSGGENVIRQVTIDAMLDLLDTKEAGTAVAGDSINFIDATDNVVKKDKISAILDLKTHTEIFSSDSGVTDSQTANRTVDEGFDNFSAIIFDMRFNSGRVVTPFVPLEVWENTTEDIRIAGSYQNRYFTLYRIDNTTFRFYSGEPGMRLYTVYGF